MWNLMFFINSVLLGIGLAIDAFSVSMANGLKEPNMKFGRMNFIAFIYGFFQFAMPMAGWICVHTVLDYFTAFQKFIPWIALILLLYIGGKMLIEGIKGDGDDDGEGYDKPLTLKILLVQGIATAIDALSVGFTIAEYNWVMAFVCSLIIAVMTHIICIVGLKIGKIAGEKLKSKAAILGGVILILIGIEIFVEGIFF